VCTKFFVPTVTRPIGKTGKKFGVTIAGVTLSSIVIHAWDPADQRNDDLAVGKMRAHPIHVNEGAYRRTVHHNGSHRRVG